MKKKNTPVAEKESCPKIVPVLTTARLTLRPAQLEDAPAVFDWSHSPEATHYLFWLPHRTPEDSKRLVAVWVRKRCHYSWLLDDHHRAIGEIELIKDLPNQGAMIGYILVPTAWHQGYMKEALASVLDYLPKVGYRYAQAETDKENLASIHLLQAMGFVPYGKEEPYFIAKKNTTITLVRFRKELLPSC
ncbi:MAG: GNAT family N-acetyltransferase [Bacilli bacterium]|jgi:[ribosomal protein S5]-alanine N-acetyltransferase|nr:GNAT family N-acetyltransferase [Bacilli bacterium]